MGPIFKTKVLICQSKANLDEKILFREITHLKDSTIRKMPVKGFYGNREFHIPFWSMIYMVMQFTLSVLEIEFKFNSK